VFTPKSSLKDGTLISVGDVLGMVGGHEVRSLFDGVLQNFISVEGERVTAHQPIAWLRTI
jgi:[acyl-carrier-protein] S-malonyltransferase